MRHGFGKAHLFGAIASVFLCGCARYEYLLVEPAHAAGTIGKQGLRVSSEPLDYRLTKRDDRRLAVTIFNPTDQPVTLVAAKSYLVDPAGQTRALNGGTIGPRSYIGMILPPEPMVYRAGPSFSFGFGTYSGRGQYYGHGSGYYIDPFYEGPRYYYLDNGPNDWRWKRGEVRLGLFYEQTGTNIFEHRFVFLRQKAKR